MKPRNLFPLLTLLLVTGCVPQQQYNQEVQQVQHLQYMDATYKQLNQNLESEVTADQVKIKQLQDRLQVTMVNAILFPEGGWELSPNGKRELSKVVPTLQSVAGKQIVIEGFTDKEPILRPLSERFPNNWYLASARAISVVSYLEKQGVDPNFLSAVSFGKYHPIAANDTPEGRAQNRRINIVIQDQTP
ncbi:MAG TPA: OmpA family protein [Candidatus Binataceae bacterium]|nr:OmpA family protein [Candidatus Binataceae bacterium]